MRCPICGNEAPSEARFCGNCGSDLSNITCPRCHALNSATTRFCTNCGNPLSGSIAQNGGTPYPRQDTVGSSSRSPEGPAGARQETPAVRREPAGSPAPRQQARPRRRGCRFWGCLTFLALLAVLVLGTAFFFRLPQKVGLFKPAVERVFSTTPDRWASEALAQELKKSGLDTKGISIYVLPVAGKDESVAYVVLQSSQGFRFQSTQGKDPILDFLTRLGAAETTKTAGIKRVAIDYRSRKGTSLLTLTAWTDDLSGFAKGSISRGDFMKKLEGQANWPGFYQEVLEW